MKFDYTTEDLILMGTKAVSYILNTFLILLLVGAVVGGIMLLINAITTPPVPKKTTYGKDTAFIATSVSAGQPIITGALFIKDDSQV